MKKKFKLFFVLFIFMVSFFSNKLICKCDHYFDMNKQKFVNVWEYYSSNKNYKISIISKSFPDEDGYSLCYIEDKNSKKINEFPINFIPSWTFITNDSKHIVFIEGAYYSKSRDIFFYNSDGELIRKQGPFGKFSEAEMTKGVGYFVLLNPYKTNSDLSENKINGYYTLVLFNVKSGKLLWEVKTNGITQYGTQLLCSENAEWILVSSEVYFLNSLIKNKEFYKIILFNRKGKKTDEIILDGYGYHLKHFSNDGKDLFLIKRDKRDKHKIIKINYKNNNGKLILINEVNIKK